MIRKFYKSMGFYSVEVEARKEQAEAGEDTLNLIFKVVKGERSKIKKLILLEIKKLKVKDLETL